MKTQKQRQVCDVSYFEDKKKNPVKATVTYPSGKRCVQFVKLCRGGAWQ